MTPEFKILTDLLQKITTKLKITSEDILEGLTQAVHEIQIGLDVDCVQICQSLTDGGHQIVAESRRSNGLLRSSFRQPFFRETFLPKSDQFIQDLETFSGTDSSAINLSKNSSNRDHSSSTSTVQTAIAIPISLPRQLWGYLRIDVGQPHQFSETEQKFLQLIASQVAMGIDHWELEQQVRQHTQQDRSFDQISKLLQEERHHPYSIQQVLVEMIVAVGGIGGRLYLRSETTTHQIPQLYTWGEQPTDSQLEVRGSWQAWISAGKTFDLSGKRMKKPPHPLDNIGIGSYPFPVIIADFHRDALPNPITPVFTSTSIGSILTISLDYENRCLGYFSVFRSNKLKSPNQLGNDFSTAQGNQILSWSAGNIRFLQSVCLHLYLLLFSEQVQRDLKYRASYDLLTRLPNRKQFELQLDQALHRTHRSHKNLAVAVLDLDEFKRVNYTLGHVIGDRLLLDVTQRLQSQLPTSTCLARWGDDRFTFLIELANSIEELTHIAQAVLNVFASPFYLQNREIYMTASLGIALAPQDGNRGIALVQNAEIAMQSAKKIDTNSYQFYVSDMNHTALTRLALETDLRQASVRNEFWLDYQPQIDLKTGKVVAMEALIRWQHPHHGILSPDSFIGIAEATGLICPIGEWVMRTACLQHQSWMRIGLPSIRIAVNLSARQLQRDLVPIVTKILHDTQMNPQDLELEITESIAVQNLELTMAILQEFQDMGITVVMDDFGTGYSCLSAIEKLPLNGIKIDRSLVVGATQNPRSAAIAKTAIALGHGLNLLVLAEGVETAEQVKFLRSIHCDLAQGNFFSSPLSSDHAIDFLQNPLRFMGSERVQ